MLMINPHGLPQPIHARLEVRAPSTFVAQRPSDHTRVISGTTEHVLRTMQKLRAPVSGIGSQTLNVVSESEWNAGARKKTRTLLCSVMARMWSCLFLKCTHVVSRGFRVCPTLFRLVFFHAMSRSYPFFLCVFLLPSWVVVGCVLAFYTFRACVQVVEPLVGELSVAHVLNPCDLLPGTLGEDRVLQTLETSPISES